MHRRNAWREQAHWNKGPRGAGRGVKKGQLAEEEAQRNCCPRGRAQTWDQGSRTHWEALRDPQSGPGGAPGTARARLCAKKIETVLPLETRGKG